MKIHRLTRIQEAHAFFPRLVGLMGRRRWPLHHDGLFFASCRSVHTWFTFARPDLIFIDDRGRVLRVFERARPWAFFFSMDASHCLELPSGWVRKLKIQLGDEVRWDGK